MAVRVALLPTNVIQAIRQYAGYCADDYQHDEYLASLPESTLFQYFCEWTGVFTWSDHLIEKYDQIAKMNGDFANLDWDLRNTLRQSVGVAYDDSSQDLVLAHLPTHILLGFYCTMHDLKQWAPNLISALSSIRANSIDAAALEEKQNTHHNLGDLMHAFSGFEVNTAQPTTA